MNKFPHWDLVIMCVALALVFAFEMLGVFCPRFVTITALCRDFIPRWLRAMICGWLVYHFVVVA